MIPFNMSFEHSFVALIAIFSVALRCSQYCKGRV